MAISRIRLLIAISLLLHVIARFGIALEVYDGDEAIEITAVSLSYFPSEAKIVGEGDVFIRHKDFNVWADKVIYLVERGEVFAEASLGRVIKISRGKHVLYGKRLYYDSFKKTGFMEHVESEEDGIRFSGERVEVALVDTVPSESFLFFKTKPQKLEKEDLEFSITTGRFTTCKLSKPTYFVSGARIVVYPGGRVRVVRPTLFVGGERVFSLPFDYSFSVKGIRGFLIMPSVGFSSSLGWYGGISVDSFSEHFPFSITLLYSEEQGFVGKAKASLKTSKNSWLSLDVERSEDWDTTRMRWRSGIELLWEGNNYKFTMRYLKDRKYWVLRDDEYIKTIYSAVPEISAKYSFNPLTLFVRWGNYEEKGVTESKLTLGAALEFDKKIGKDLSLTSKLIYIKDYYEGDQERELAYYQGIISWDLGKLTVLSGYLERKVSGETPFYFDRYDPLRKYLVGFEYQFQDLALKVYLYYDDLKNGWRDIKGEFSFSLGSKAYLSIKPWYYLDEDRWREVNYGLIYHLCPCGCMSLSIDFHNDLRRENEDVFWLRFYIHTSSLSFVSGTLPGEDSLIPP